MILQGQSVPQMVPGGGTGSSVVQTTNNNGLYPPGVSVPNQMMANPNQPLNNNHPNLSNNGLQQPPGMNGGPMMSPNPALMNGMPPNMNPMAGGRPRIMQNGGNMMGSVLNPPVPNPPTRPKRPRAKNPTGRGSRAPRSKTQNQQQPQQQQLLNPQNNNMMSSMLNSHGGGGGPNMANYHPHPQQQNPLQQHHPQQSSNFFNNDFEAWQHQQLNNSNPNNNCHPQNSRNTPPSSLLPSSPNMILSYPNLRRMNPGGVVAGNNNGIIGPNNPGNGPPPPPNSANNRMMSPHQGYFPPQQHQLQAHHHNPSDIAFLPQSGNGNNNNPNTSSSSSCDNSNSSQLWQHHQANTPTSSSSIINHYPSQQLLQNPNNPQQGLSNIQNHSNSNSTNNGTGGMLQRSSSFTHSPLPQSMHQHQQQHMQSMGSNDLSNHDRTAASTPTNQFNQVASPYSSQPTSRPHSRTNNLPQQQQQSHHHHQQNQQQPPPQQQQPMQIDSLKKAIVCPITHGLVWGPNSINLDEVMNQPLPNGVLYKTFEFDLSKSHLDTIITRSDLDIAISSHLFNEPMQICQWPNEDIQIIFNKNPICLDRSLVVKGKPAHKVSCIKQFCIPGRNVIEVNVPNLGEDPNNPEVMIRRRQASNNLKPFKFVAFMAHMPPLDLLLAGLQRKHICDLPKFVELVESRTANQPNKFVILPLVCHDTGQRIGIPGRTSDCKHIDTFDLEVFLDREVLWPRLRCPICRIQIPSGLDGLCIDSTVQFALKTFSPSVDSIFINNEGQWSLGNLVTLPPGEAQWQPIIGPMTKGVFMALNDISSSSPFIKSDEKAALINGKNVSEPPSISRTSSSNKLGNQTMKEDNSVDSKSNESSSESGKGMHNQNPVTLSKQDYSGIPKELINFAAANTNVLEPFLQSDYITFLEEYL